MATNITQTNSTLATFPAAFDDPANTKKVAKDRDGFPVGATKIRQARWEEFRETQYHYGGGTTTQTITPDSIIGGAIRITNAGGNFNIQLPAADDMAIALGAYAPINPNPAPTPAASAGASNPPGSWKKRIVFFVANASGATATFTVNTRMTVDGASSAALATGTSGTYAICSSVDTVGSIAYILQKL